MSTIKDKVDTRASVADLRKDGLAVCKPNKGEKKPTYKGWSTRSLEPDDFAPGDLIGIQGGPLSDYNRPGHALVIIDLDVQEAIEKADDYLLHTDMAEGRPGKPRDHRYYLVPLETIPKWAWSTAEQGAAAAKAAKGHPGPWKKGFNHTDTNKRILDFIGTGGQVVAPSPGANERKWGGDKRGEPAVVPFLQLWNAICKLAVACGGKDETPRADTEREAPRQERANTDALLKRIIAYLDKCDPAVSEQNGHADTYWPARVVCWGFDCGEEEGFRILSQYFNPRCVPPWSEKDLRHKCRDADKLPFGQPRGWLLTENNSYHASNGKAQTKSAPAGPKVFPLGSLTLRPGKPRQTASGKISIPVATWKDGAAVFPFVLSSAASGRKEPARVLAAQFLADDAKATGKIDATLISILAWASEELRTCPATNGPTIREIVKEKVPEDWRLTHRLDRGAWSESRQEIITRSDFIAYTPNALLDEAAAASDAPRDEQGRTHRGDLLRLVETELKVLWADLFAGLPLARDCDLPATSAAAASFRNAMVRLWTRTQTFEVVDGSDTGDGKVTARASLVSRVLTRKKKYAATGGKKWNEAQHAFHSWWRVWVDSEGEEKVLLAMRWSLMDQAGVRLPGVVDQESLTDLGKRFGVVQDPPPGIPSVLSGGRTRLAVLSLDLAEELLSEPIEAPETNPREPGE